MTPIQLRVRERYDIDTYDVFVPASAVKWFFAWISWSLDISLRIEKLVNTSCSEV